MRERIKEHQYAIRNRSKSNRRGKNITNRGNDVRGMISTSIPRKKEEWKNWAGNLKFQLKFSNPDKVISCIVMKMKRKKEKKETLTKKSNLRIPSCLHKLKCAGTSSWHQLCSTQVSEELSCYTRGSPRFFKWLKPRSYYSIHCRLVC